MGRKRKSSKSSGSEPFDTDDLGTDAHVTGDDLADDVTEDHATEDDGAPGQHTVTVATEQSGWRLDRCLAALLPALSRSRLQALVRAGAVTSDGRTIGDAGARVKPGDTLVVDVPAAAPAEPQGEPIALTVVYEDAALIVVDKPAGLVVHPAAGHSTGTLVNALIAHCGDSLSGIGGVKRPGIVHRLDKDTSGLLVVAKTDAAHQGLAEQFASHGADGRLWRRYVALCWGAPVPRVGRIEADLARSVANRTKIAVVRAGKGRHAATVYEVERAFAAGGRAAVVAEVGLVLETGRTHQIRVHMAHIGHPLLGDEVYGASHKTSVTLLDDAARQALAHLGRQALHAAELGFEHPISGRPMRFAAPLPADLQRLRAALELGSADTQPTLAGRPRRAGPR